MVNVPEVFRTLQGNCKYEIHSDFCLALDIFLLLCKDAMTKSIYKRKYSIWSLLPVFVNVSMTIRAKNMTAGRQTHTKLKQ